MNATNNIQRDILDLNNSTPFSQISRISTTHRTIIKLEQDKEAIYQSHPK